MIYRAYFWGNFYLSSIQQGIQAGHVIADMSQSCKTNDDFIQWALDDQVMIVKNGGDNKAIKELVSHFEQYANDYSWDYFSESGDALNYTFTSVGIIVPDYIWNANEPYCLEGFEKGLYEQIKNTRMAI